MIVCSYRLNIILVAVYMLDCAGYYHKCFIIFGSTSTKTMLLLIPFFEGDTFLSFLCLTKEIKQLYKIFFSLNKTQCKRCSELKTFLLLNFWFQV